MEKIMEKVKKRILIIDDDQSMGEVLCAWLEIKNFEPEYINCPQKGLSIACTKKWDIIITDYDMPDLTGHQLCIKLKKIIPKIPVILHTGNIHQVESINFFDAVIEKPAKIQKYIDTINMLYLSQSKQLT